MAEGMPVLSVGGTPVKTEEKKCWCGAAAVGLDDAKDPACKEHFGKPEVKMTLREALDEVDSAIICVRENRGYDKEQAKEALSHCIGEVLMPVLMESIENLDDEKKIIKIAQVVMKLMG